MSGSASAGSQSEGTIGTAGAPVDVESEDINNADTVTTQDLVVNGKEVGGVFADAGVNITENTTDGIVEITGLNGLRTDILEFNIAFGNVGAGGEYTLRFNGDQDGNGNYAYYDETGAKITGEDGILLFDSSVIAPHCESYIRASKAGSFPGINHQFNAGRAKASSFSLTGGRPGDAQDINSIEIHIPSTSFDQVSVEFIGIKDNV
jgi:hypothetical protein